MKTKQILVSLTVMLVAILAISTVMAGTLDVSIDKIEINDVDIAEVQGTLSDLVGEEIEVLVQFTVTDTEDLEDLKVKTWISGYKNEIEDQTARFDALSGRTYIKVLTLDLPTVRDLEEELGEDFTLHVEISDKNNDLETEFDMTVQRETYAYNLLSVEAPSTASAGDVIALDVVLKNTGSNKLEDAFVTAKIPELGIYKKVYFGDITPEDNWDEDDDEDARYGRIYLVVPADTMSGDYTVEVEVSNYDASAEVLKSITIDGLEENDDVVDTNDIKDDEGVSNSVIILTIVLVIIFLVLLIVLIVLLTKKPAERIEDFGETSYY